MTSYFGCKQQILLKSITSKLYEQYAQIGDKPMSAMWSHQIRLKRIHLISPAGIRIRASLIHKGKKLCSLRLSRLKGGR